MNSEIKRQIVNLANENPNEEICGFIYYTLKGVFIYPCVNVADDKSKHFIIAPEQFVECQKLGKICGIYHSHLEFDEFSNEDIETSEEFLIPFYLYNVKTGFWGEYMPMDYKVPLIGRPFIWGLFDCYSLVKDFYRQELKIKLPDFESDGSFMTGKNNRINDNYPSMGFYKNHDRLNFKKHDVIVFLPRFVGGGHLGIYMGGNNFLHHPLSGLSVTEPIGPWFRKINFGIRYLGV